MHRYVFKNLRHHDVEPLSNQSQLMYNFYYLLLNKSLFKTQKKKKKNLKRTQILAFGRSVLYDSASSLKVVDVLHFTPLKDDVFFAKLREII